MGAVSERLRPRVRRVVRNQLRTLRGADPDAVTSSVFRYFAAVARRGSFGDGDFAASGELWAWILRVARNKVRDHARYHRAEVRDAARTRREDSAFVRPGGEDGAGFGLLAGAGPTPAEEAASAELLTAFLAGLPDPLLRDVVLLRLDGCTVPEVAARVGKSERTVKRKLERVRDHWSEHWADDWPGADRVTNGRAPSNRPAAAPR